MQIQKFIPMVAVSAVLALSGFGCGSDDPATDSSATGGSTSTGGSSSSSGGTIASGSGGSTTTGGAFMLPFDAGLPTCDMSAPTTATCGGVDCPALGGFAAFTCTVPCCTSDNKCGTQTAEANMAPTECMAPPEEDARCPSYQGGGAALPGCCTADNQCGYISQLSNTCITESQILMDLASCGACGSCTVDSDAGM